MPPCPECIKRTYENNIARLQPPVRLPFVNQLQIEHSLIKTGFLWKLPCIKFQYINCYKYNLISVSSKSYLLISVLFFIDFFIKRHSASPRCCRLLKHLFRKGFEYQSHHQTHRKRIRFRTGKFFCFLTEETVSLRKQFAHCLIRFCGLNLFLFILNPDSEITSFHQTAAITNTQIFRQFFQKCLTAAKLAPFRKAALQKK